MVPVNTFRSFIRPTIRTDLFDNRENSVIETTPEMYIKKKKRTQIFAVDRAQFYNVLVFIRRHVTRTICRP